MNDYELYCDGAYSTSRNQGGIGIVILKDNKPVFMYNKMYKNTTNIKMELLALIHGLKVFNKPFNSLNIYTDSQYCIGCATLGWQRKKNQSYWKVYDQVMDELKNLCSNIKFNHVKGHTDNYWNNFVDRLAVEASHQID